MKKYIVISIICCFIVISILPLASSINLDNRFVYSVNSTVYNPFTMQKIFKEIEETDNKKLVVDKIIGNIKVKYWQHEINDAIVKNDYILLHQSYENDEILKYEKIWTDLLLQNCSKLPKINFGKNFWMQVVVFPEVDDLTYFYRLETEQEFPFVCLEIRYFDGRTTLYDLKGNNIGSGIPAPVMGFSLSGYHNASWPDPWKKYRENADFWFSKWCDKTTSLSLPKPSTISSYVRDTDVMYFFEMAHGNEYNFQANSVGIVYNSIMVSEDMASRQPMEFAFIGSCHGMTTTGPGTFSYEFRKGQINNTVTIGFDHMETCPGWQYSFNWQDSMFENMSKGMTIKNAFDIATAQYPTIAQAVVFLGDQNLIVPLPPSKPNKPSGPTSGHVGTTYSYTTTTIDPNGDKIKYGWDWNDDNIVDKWEDNNSNYYISGTTITTSHSWNNKNVYDIKVKAEDINGIQSDWSEPLTVTMPKNKPYINRLFQDILEKHPLLYQLIQGFLHI